MNTQIKFTTAAEAVKVIKSGDHIHLSSVASAPQCLIKAMCERGANHEFKDVHIHHLHTEGPAPYADPQFEGIFQLDSFFVGGNVRKVTQSGYADYIPIFLSETQKLYRSGTVPCDVAMIQVSTPDKHGYVSLGTSVDATLAAVETARTVIAVVNKHVPRSFGDAMIHSSKIDLFVQDDTPLEEAHFTEPNEIETRIGKHCAALIEDGATLQMGIGAIPNAVLAQLDSAVITSFPRILNLLQSTQDKQALLDRMQRYSLLVLDDLGAERDTAYAAEQVFNVVDARVQTGLPLVVTTNLSVKEMQEADSMQLKRIYDRVLSLTEQYLPDEMAIEAPFFGKNVQSMLKLGRAQGVAMAAALSRDVPITEYEPRKIKMAITGNGGASKEQVREMLRRILNIPEEHLLPQLDSTDALAAALCHFYESTRPHIDKGCSSWKEFIAKNPGRVK